MNAFDDIFDEFEAEDIFDNLSDFEKVVYEANEKLTKLFKESVKKTIAAAYKAESELESLQQKVIAARNQAQEWERKAIQARVQFEKADIFDIPREYIGRIVHNLTDDFRPGDKAYVIEKSMSTKTCSRCQGKKKIKVNDGGEKILVDCPDCNGSGVIWVINPDKIVAKTVTSVRLNLNFSEDGIFPWSRDCVYLDNSCDGINPNDLYHTSGEAMEALKREQDRLYKIE